MNRSPIASSARQNAGEFSDPHRRNTADVAEREVLRQYDRMCDVAKSEIVAALLTVAWSVLTAAERSR